MERLFFPVGKAANILRGALGTIFRGMACLPGCPGAKDCERRLACPYARVFEPGAAGEGPSGLADWPRPFVFRARHLDGRVVEPGESFYFDLHLFLLEREVVEYLTASFAALAKEGLGPRRGKAELQRVARLAVGGQGAGDWAPVALSLDAVKDAPGRVRVNFLSPIELKSGNQVVTRPDFSVLFGRVRDRISTLRNLYGAGPLEIDYVGASARAAGVRITHYRFERTEAQRRSSRSGQSHSIGGYVGSAEYEGELGEFLPYLEAARWTGVGRQCVWGKGEIEVRGVDDGAAPF